VPPGAPDDRGRVDLSSFDGGSNYVDSVQRWRAEILTTRVDHLNSRSRGNFLRPGK